MPSIQIFWDISVTEYWNPHPDVWYQVYMDFRGVLDGKESACDAGDLGSFPESGRSPGEENGYPLQYPCLENPCTEEPGNLGSQLFMGSQRVRHEWATKHARIYSLKWKF